MATAYQQAVAKGFSTDLLQQHLRLSVHDQPRISFQIRSGGGDVVCKWSPKSVVSGNFFGV